MNQITNIDIQCNPWMREVWNFIERYLILVSGRDAGKDWGVAQKIIIEMLLDVIKVMFARQFQNSISYSIKALVEEVIDSMGLNHLFNIGDQKITSVNGSEAHFRGVDRNIQSIKGWQGYKYLVLNEAQSISKASWNIITPTMRKQGSQIIVIMNPQSPLDATAVNFLGPDLVGFDDPDVKILHLSWEQNMFLSDTSRKEIERMREADPILFAHIYGGQYDIGTLNNPFDRDSIKNSRGLQLSRTGDPAYCFVDIAVTENNTSDNTVAMLCDKFGNVLKHIKFKKEDYAVAVAQIVAFAGNTRIYVDGTGTGKTIADMIKDNHKNTIKIIINNTLKREMIGALSGCLDAGKISIPLGEDWDWVQEELLHFERKTNKLTGELKNEYGAAESYHDDGVTCLMFYANLLWKKKFDAGAYFI